MSNDNRVFRLGERLGRLLASVASPLIPPLEAFDEEWVLRLPSSATCLAEWLQQATEEAIWRLGERLALALKPFHAAGYLVVNLDPESLFVTADGQPLLVDFDSLSLPGALEHPEQLFFSQYAAPECLEHREIGPSSDVYALGCLLYRLLAKTPYDPDVPEASLLQIPFDQRHLLSRMLSLEPECRHRDLDELLRDMAIMRRGMRHLHVEAATLSHPGLNPSRALNQDASLLVWQQDADWSRERLFGLFAVIDGMGGMEDGHCAAERVRNSFRRSFQELAIADPLPTAEDLMIRAHHAVSTLEGESGAAATLILLEGDRIELAQVGDTRAYLIRDGQACRLTRDQSMRSIRQGGRGDAADRSLLVSSLGAPGPDSCQVGGLEDILSDGRQLPDSARGRHLYLRDGDQILLCSDGLWDWWDDDLSEDEEMQYLADRIDPAQPLPDILSQLVEDALCRDGQDNATALLIRYRSKRLLGRREKDLERGS